MIPNNRFLCFSLVLVCAVCLPISAHSSDGMLEAINRLTRELPASCIATPSVPVVEETGEALVSAHELILIDSPDELLGSSDDGYPAIWLAEILQDESIPEIDRYWLDCRMRALYAVELHRFYNESGREVNIEAEWILPGEDYWRESYLVNPPGSVEGSSSILRSSGGRMNPGYSVDKFGNRIGNFEQVGNTLKLDTSRDGTVSVAAFPGTYGYQPVYQYSDRSILISPITMTFGLANLSSSGEYVILSSLGNSDQSSPEASCAKAVLLDKNGVVQWEVDLELVPVGNPAPTISPDDQYAAIVTQAIDIRDADLRGMLQVFSVSTGEEVWRIENPPGSTVRYSANGGNLCISGGGAMVLETATGRVLWSESVADEHLPQSAVIRYLSCSNNAELITGMAYFSEKFSTHASRAAIFDCNGNQILTDPSAGHIDTSPNGIFVLTEGYLPHREFDSVFPVGVYELREGN